MSMHLDLMLELTSLPSKEAWKVIVDRALEICRQPLSPQNASAEVTRRDRAVGEIDQLLSSGAWTLWREFPSLVPRNADQIVKWWQAPFAAKAVLVLDGLSLRETPWLIEGAKARGFTIGAVSAHAAEIPSDTNSFAKALGFSSRSQLQNNGGGMANRLAPAKTECVDLPWQDCAGLIDASPNWVFWHHWPDSKVHDGSGAGQGLDGLTRDVAAQLTSEDFWIFVDRLATGRRLVITSDHGYAATGLFYDAADDQAAFLKTNLKSGRFAPGQQDSGAFVPPVALNMASAHGDVLTAIGRLKWKSQGGYPTLAHGGMSLLEMLSPFIEIWK